MMTLSLDPVSRDVRDEHDVLRDEQRVDPTLERAWVWAQKNKNNFFVKNELLYRRDKVLQQNVQQICLPVARRNEVCRLAHDMCHLGYKRTKEKLRLNFFWPGVMDMSSCRPMGASVTCLVILVSGARSRYWN